MKRLLASLMFFGFLQMFSGAQAAQPPEPFHLFLLAGQSNMAGRGGLDEAGKTADERVWKWSREDRWEPATEPIHRDKAGAGAGLAKSFAKALTQADPALSVGLIPAACGGSPIAVWQPGAFFQQTKSHPYDDAVARTRAALAGGGTLKAILWHQGESDCSPRNAAVYEEKLRELITRFRTEFGNPELPFIIGQLGEFPGKEWSESHRTVDAAHRHLAATMPNVYFVSSEGLSDKGDKLHFSTEALRTLGQRYAERYLETERK